MYKKPGQDNGKGQALTPGKRLLYAVVAMPVGLLVYGALSLLDIVQLAGAAGAVAGISLGFMLGLLFPMPIRNAFLFFARETYDPDYAKEGDGHLVEVFIITVIVVAVLFLVS